MPTYGIMSLFMTTNQLVFSCQPLVFLTQIQPSCNSNRWSDLVPFLPRSHHLVLKKSFISYSNYNTPKKPQQSSKHNDGQKVMPEQVERENSVRRLTQSFSAWSSASFSWSLCWAKCSSDSSSSIWFSCRSMSK